MLGIIALILIAIVAVSILSFAAHILFSPLVLVIVGILLWMKLRPRRSHQ
jgi:threonine/homoserine/homoserine lactone efflux protein